MALLARVWLIALAVAAVAAPPARAQDTDVTSRMVALNRDALGEIDKKSFAAARKHLLESVALAKRHGLENTPVLARTYFHLGALAIIADSDRRTAAGWFAKALDVMPDIRPSAVLRGHADVIAIFQATVDGELTGCVPQCPLPDVDDAPDPELPARIVGLDRRHDDSVAAQSPLVVRCAAHESIEVTSLYLHYKSDAATRFKDVMMRITERGWWKAAVPATDVAGTSVRLYIDGRNARGRRLRSELGDARRPTTVSVSPVVECRCAPQPRPR